VQTSRAAAGRVLPMRSAAAAAVAAISATFEKDHPCGDKQHSSVGRVPRVQQSQQDLGVGGLVQQASNEQGTGEFFLWRGDRLAIPWAAQGFPRPFADRMLEKVLICDILEHGNQQKAPQRLDNNSRS
jgi:hypothetical protein